VALEKAQEEKLRAAALEEAVKKRQKLEEGEKMRNEGNASQS
jgi:hypothetical protein